MAFKPKKIGGGSGVDYDRINEQVEEGSHDARISGVIDLGVHEQPVGIDTDRKTYVSTEEEAIELINMVEDRIGEKDLEEKGLDAVEEVGDIYRLPFKIVKDQYVFVYEAENDPFNVTYVDCEKEAEALLDRAKELDKFKKLGKVDGYEVIENALELQFGLFTSEDANEIAVAADLVDTYVEYVEGEQPNQYRYYFNSVWQGDMRGFPLPVYRGKNTKTFSKNSTMAKLINNTGQKQIMKSNHDDYNDVEVLVGKPLQLAIQKSDKGFIRHSGMVPVRPNDKIASLDIDGYPDGICIQFDSATVEQLEAFRPRKAVIDKIKAAKNYEGSAMQAAIEEYEAQNSSGDDKTQKADTKAKEEEPQKEEKAEEKTEAKSTKRTVNRKSSKSEEKEEEKPASTRKKLNRGKKKEEGEKKPEAPDEPEGEEFDDDDGNPFGA
jgi:hypothetical protein